MQCGHGGICKDCGSDILEKQGHCCFCRKNIEILLVLEPISANNLEQRTNQALEQNFVGTRSEINEHNKSKDIKNAIHVRKVIKAIRMM